jgi:uncharacterized protein YkwD
MKQITISLLFGFIFFTTAIAQQTGNKNISVCLSANEIKLYKLVMEYRKTVGLPAISLSTSLCFVAQTHCKDLANNKPNSGRCNLHSWSSNAHCSSCCYTPDHAKANCMWAKPRELTNYTGNGFEIAYNIWHSDDANYTVQPEEALKGWQQSTGHNEVIINKGIWKNMQWNAIGIGTYKGFAVIWFGTEKDVESMPLMCN